MRVKYFRNGKWYVAIVQEIITPKEAWRRLRLKFFDLQRIEIDGKEYEFIDGLQQTELLKRLHKND